MQFFPDFFAQYTIWIYVSYINKYAEYLFLGNPNICDGPPKISWRGNGEQFVINFFKDGFRYLKVFDNQFNPLFESVENFNLREPTSFMGQGQYIASCITEENVNHLIIFEKNCKMKAITELKQTQVILF